MLELLKAALDVGSEKQSENNTSESKIALSKAVDVVAGVVQQKCMNVEDRKAITSCFGVIQKIAADARGQHLQNASNNKKSWTPGYGKLRRKRAPSSSPKANLDRRKKIDTDALKSGSPANGDENDDEDIWQVATQGRPTKKADDETSQARNNGKDRRRAPMRSSVSTKRGRGKNPRPTRTRQGGKNAKTK